MKLVNKSIDDILTSPWALWAISVATAMALWFYVTGTEESDYVTRKFTCPLEYRSLDPQTVLRGRIQEVDIEIRGLESDMARLNYDAVACFVDARSLAPGKRYTQNVSVALPPDITLVSCVPSQVVLDLVRQIVRLMPVEAVLPKDIPEGQYLEGVEVIPKEVGVRGMEGDVAKVGALRVMPSIEELQSGKELLLPLKFVQSEPFDGTVTLEPAQVRFKGTLARGLPKRKVPVNVRLSGELDADHEIRSIVTDPSEVQVEGALELLDRVEAVDTETVDISLFTENQAMVVPLKAPDVEGVALSGGGSVRITLQMGEVKAGKTLANIPVEVRGTARGWTVNPPSVTVTVEGSPSKIESVAAGDIGLRAWADLSNIFVTPVTLPVRTELASGDFSVVKTDPPTVTFNAAEDLEKW
ncbi:MAG: hypothetical protein IJ702_00055 [Fretibacterium sp.]|nr:hypothetical protein [Fretibacterium sp.]